MECSAAVIWMHDYLDDDLPREDAVRLKAHLAECAACQARFEQLERTESFAHSALRDASARQAEPAGYDREALKRRIMGQLPVRRRKRVMPGWVRNHPAATVAAVFAIIMVSSFFSMWQQNSELVVRGADLQHVVIDGDTVTVPAGAEVRGDLTVENGKTQINGKVDGNLTVIDGSVNLASTAQIVGQERVINQALDWLWYKVTHTVSGLAS